MPVVGKWVLRPHPRNHANGFFPLGSGLFRIDLEPVHLDQGRGASGAQIHTAITDDIEHGGALSYPHRMVILAWQEGYGVANANALGALGEGPVEDFEAEQWENSRKKWCSTVQSAKPTSSASST